MVGPPGAVKAPPPQILMREDKDNHKDKDKDNNKDKDKDKFILKDKYPQGQGSTMMRFDDSSRSEIIARMKRPSKLSVSLPVGLNHFTRRFTSNIGTLPLGGLTAAHSPPLSGSPSPHTSLSTSMQRRVLTLPWVRTSPYRWSHPSRMSRGECQSGQQLADLKLNVGAPISLSLADAFWVGATLGAQYFSSKYTEVQYLPPQRNSLRSESAISQRSQAVEYQRRGVQHD